ncbi:amino acid permease/ SLC12A domain-containing protein [Lobosporangium transversale]|uniref:Amino acid permease/ SLC12A domain-containing protein n=1 Tax=Lobosporangium transversale TaxID=64571 RepID=A0A1Y2H164_9FUNG|nr:amino acid permease/ SLC12A domain-containing protein [Lobosporangium transversale]ORZ28265.1 amino acid permease/ SLC12A domain-containing protein [Lobosporangium transversale]|eukprot:XP_021885950.1 amino acid permease/ SLC12A domain-containing protein [Lobosporangium transversale]
MSNRLSADVMESYTPDPTTISEKKYDDSHSMQEGQKREGNECATGDGLQRNLAARHLTMISLGGTIGTGLFLASGASIATGGPGYSLIAYMLIGTMVYCFMSSLGEMTTYLPISGSMNAYGTRFFDPALGFMLGWIYWFSWSITVATELVASGLIISYWIPDETCPPWVWALVFIVILTSLNLVSVKAYGESEYWLALIKVLAVMIFIIVGFLYIGGAVGTQQAGEPKPGPEVFNMSPFHGGFAGLFSIFLNAGFSFQGAELVGIAAGETKNPRKNVPRAIRQVFWRIIMFYVLTMVIIGMAIPYTDNALANSNGDIKSSPFTRVFVRAGINVGEHIMNAVILIAILSAGNSGLYASSRALHTLSKEGSAPKFMSYVNRHGVPVYCVLATMLVGCLAFIVSLDEIGKGQAYEWLLSLSSTTGFISWLGIAFSHLRFRMAYKAQGRSLKDLPFVSSLYPVGPIYTIIVCVIILLAQGYTAFSPFNVKAFLSAYVTLPFVFILYFGKKFWNKTKIIRLVDVDLDTGRSFIETTMPVLSDTASEAAVQPSKMTQWRKRVVNFFF